MDQISTTIYQIVADDLSLSQANSLGAACFS